MGGGHVLWWYWDIPHVVYIKYYGATTSAGCPCSESTKVYVDRGKDVRSFRSLVAHLSSLRSYHLAAGYGSRFSLSSKLVPCALILSATPILETDRYPFGKIFVESEEEFLFVFEEIV